MSIKEQIKERLSKIKLLIMDVDGTLTDSGMYYSANGEELKRFSTRDGMAINLLRRGGIEVAIMTSEITPIVSSRALKLSIENVILGTHDKSADVKLLAERLKLDLSEIAFIGDDVNDEHVMKLVGFSACPKDASKVIKKISGFICKSKGGHGAVREFAELILLAQNKQISIQEQW